MDKRTIDNYRNPNYVPETLAIVEGLGRAKSTLDQIEGHLSLAFDTMKAAKIILLDIERQLEAR